MLNEIKCRLMYLKLKARLFHLKKKPECYSVISDVLVSAFMNTTNPHKQENVFPTCGILDGVIGP